MSIASEITRIKNNIANAYIQAENKGATMPQTQNSDNLSSTIASITGGGSLIPTKSTNTRINNVIQGYLDWLEQNPYSAMTPKGSDYAEGDVSSYFDEHSVVASNQNYPNGVDVTLGAGKLSTTDNYTGLTLEETVSGGNKTIYNVINGNYVNTDSNGNIIGCGTLSQTGNIRMIKTRAGNVRDLGGWACDGGTVKYGLLFRGRELSEDDIPVLVNQCGVRRELNLRGAETSNTTSPLGTSVKFYRPTVFNAYTLVNPYMKETIEYVFDAIKHKEPVYFHCYAGADRTATLALILEAILGVSQVDTDIDYELTTFYFGTATAAATRSRNEYDWVGYTNEINNQTGSTFRDKILNYLGSLGFSAVQINAFRHSMIDGTPQDISLDSDNRTVTNTLTHCTNSNEDTVVKKDESYTATITPDTDYVIHNEDVTITMEGIDITSSVYNNGNINIPVITGDITITITAVKPITYTNQITISTDENGNIYNNGLGYKDGYRLNSGGTEAALAGAVATGFIPVTAGDTIRLAGEYIGGDLGSQNTWFYDSTKTKVTTTTNITPFKLKSDDASLTVFEPYTYDRTAKQLSMFTIPNDSNIAYMRCTLNASTGANAIITVNEYID